MMFDFRACERLIAAGLLMIAATGCGKKEQAAVPPAPAPLARVGDSEITESEFLFEVNRRAQTGRATSDKASILNEMIEREVMLQKAKSDAAMQDPEVQRSMENQMLSHWLDGSLQQMKNQVTVSDDELRAAYEADRAAHTRPAMIRVAMLYRKVPPSELAEDNQSARAELLAARDAYVRDPAVATQNGRISGFGAVAADVSEDAASRYRGGDIGWHEPGKDAYRWPKPVMDAAFALNKGEISELIAHENGLYLVMKSDERPEAVTPFEEARITMRRGMIRAKQDAVEAQFRSNLMSGVKVEINQEVLGRLELPQRAQSGIPGLSPASPAVDANAAPKDS